MIIWTVGHSTQPVAALIESLALNGVQRLVDVRRYPMSRRNPQFNRDALAASLAADTIGYRHAPELGGRREPDPDSTNTALRDAGFRGFADYMTAPEFEAALALLLEEAAAQRIAIMCAESLPWRCHRSLISDALLARGIEVQHIIGDKTRAHTLSATGRVTDGRVVYPALL